MKKMTANKSEEPKKPNLWWIQHRDFVDWWKDHEQSGFAADIDRQWHWNITPRLAWNCARYRSEFSGQDEYATKEDMQR